jgi:hypothetical protein
LFLVGALVFGFALAFYIELKDFWEPLGSFQKLSSSVLSVLGMILVHAAQRDEPPFHALTARTLSHSHAGRD